MATGTLKESELSALLDVDRALLSKTDLDSILTLVTDSAIGLVNAEGATLMLVDPAHQDLYTRVLECAEPAGPDVGRPHRRLMAARSRPTSNTSMGPTSPGSPSPKEPRSGSTSKPPRSSSGSCPGRAHRSPVFPIRR